MKLPVFLLIMLACLAIVCVPNTKGLRCYQCNSMSENDKCNENIQQCSINQGSCMNEIRLNSGTKRITKTCKQTLACEGQENQNTANCNEGTINSVCYHCCQDDLCNLAEVPSASTTTTISTTTTVSTPREKETSQSTVTTPGLSTSQTCYVCSGVESNEECNRNEVQCNGNEGNCLNEIRISNGRKSITKTCKQAVACESQTSQNENSCKKDSSNSVCYYCCQGNLCNQNEDPTSTDTTSSTTTSSMSTTRPTTTTTRPTTTTTRPTTTTTRLTTKTTTIATTPLILTQGSCPTLNAPRYGRMSCTEGSMKNSRCKFTCDNQYEVAPGTNENIRCVCEGNGCFWNGKPASCIYSADTPVACNIPDFTKISYRVEDIWQSTGYAFLRVMIRNPTNANRGWSFMLNFAKPLPDGFEVLSESVTLTATSNDNRILTFSSSELYQDISEYEIFDVRIIITKISKDTLFLALAGFYEKLVNDGSCIQVISPVRPLPTTTTTTTTTTSTTPTSSTTTESTISTTTTSSTTTTTTPTTTTTTTTTPTTTTTIATTTPALSDNCEILSNPSQPGYLILNNGWTEGSKWKFSSRLEKYPVGGESLIDWTFKIQFDKPVDDINIYTGVAHGPYDNGLIWKITPMSWNTNVKDPLKLNFLGTMFEGTSAPTAIVMFCRNGEDPGVDQINGGETATESSTVTTTISTSNPGQTVSSITTSNDRCQTNSPYGSFPSRSDQTDATGYNPSPVYSANSQSSSTSFDYNEVLHKSILFYEAQKSGKLTSSNRIPWRGDSGLKDGCDVNVDLTGGFYDAGDNVKFGFPMAYTITVLSWGMIEFKSAYESSGDWQAALNIIKWGTDYFIKAHPSKYELYVQVGNADSDHSQWLRPEDIDYLQKSYKIDKNNPGSEVAAETAAAMAAASILFRTTDSSYADTLVNHAKELFDFATTYKGDYHSSVSNVINYYKSWSGYQDELLWAATWLYKATNLEFYKNWAVNNYQQGTPTEFSWDNKLAGAQVLLAQITGNNDYKTNVENFVKMAMNIKTTPLGLTWASQWGSNRYAANFAFIAVTAAKVAGLSNSVKDSYIAYAKTQINYMLGENEQKISYVIGKKLSSLVTNSPKKPHHRASSCPAWTSTPVSKCGWFAYNTNQPNPHILYGALVGGPDTNGNYNDDRKDYISNEVAVDYNAGFQSAVAGLQYFALLNKGSLP